MKPVRKLFSSIGFDTFVVFECHLGVQRLGWFVSNGDFKIVSIQPGQSSIIYKAALRHYIPKIERFLVKGGYDVSLLDPYKAVLPEWKNKTQQP